MYGFEDWSNRADIASCAGFGWRDTDIEEDASWRSRGRRLRIGSRTRARRDGRLLVLSSPSLRDCMQITQYNKVVYFRRRSLCC